MESHIINDVKFTKTEIKILTCYACQVVRSKIIGSILGSSPKTIDTHVDNIKRKINAHNKNDVIFFIKNSKQLNQLKDSFNKRYIDYRYTKVAKNIAHNLALLNVKCICSITPKLSKNEEVDKICQAIKLINVKLEVVNNLQLLLDSIASLSAKKFGLFIVKNVDEIKSLHKHINNESNSIIYICLGAQKNQTKFANDINIFFYNKNNKKEFYHFLINYLIKNYPEIEQLNKELDLLSSVGSIENNSQSNDEIEPSVDSRLNFKTFALGLLFIAALLYTTGKWIFNYKAQANQESMQIKEHNMSIFNLPYKLKHFVSRKNLTQGIQAKFDAHGTEETVVLGLCGLAGVGKTTLATNIIHNSKYNFKGWFSAENKELLKGDYLYLGDKHHLFTSDMSERLKIESVKRWLESKDNILLVYDNAPDVNLLKDYLPQKGHILITSRNSKMPGAFEIEQMNNEEATQLLYILTSKHFSGKKHTNFLSELADTLGFFPLALSQAGSYMDENHMPPSEYLKLYVNHKKKLLSNHSMPVFDEHAPAYVTWDMTIDKIRHHKNGQQALSFLNFISCFHAENIPKRLLAHCLYDSFDGETMLMLNDVLSVLRQYSFVKMSPNTISVHRLVSQWLHERLDEETKIKFLEKSILALRNIYPWGEKREEDISLVKLLLPHAKSVLSQAKNKKGVNFVEVLAILGDGYFTIGDYGSSKIFFEEALKWYEMQPVNSTADNNSLSKVLINLGIANHKVGDYTNAQKLLERGLEIQEDYYGSEDIKIVKTLIHIARACLNLGDDLRAKKLLERALKIAEAFYGVKHVGTAHILHQLGKTYIHLGNNLDAEQALKQALSLNEQKYGKDSIKTAFTLRQLGRVYRNLGNYTKAQELLNRALGIQEDYYGAEHVEVAFTLHLLGRTCVYLGDYLQGKKLLERAISIRIKYYGSDHVKTAHVFDGLGVYHLFGGDANKGKVFLEKALQIIVRHYGNIHPLTLRTLGNLALSYLKLGDYKKGKKILEDISNTISNDAQEKGVFYAISLSNLGNAYRLLGDPQEALTLLQKSLELLRGFYGNSRNVAIAKVIGNIGLTYGELEEITKKHEFLEEALQIFRNNLHPDNIHIKNTVATIAVESKITDVKHIGYPLILLI